MLCIPYLDSSRYTKKLRFRCIEDHDHGGHGKYEDMPHAAAMTFNTGAILAAEDELHITEGEMDAITLEQLGYHAIALPGANTWRLRHAKMVAGFKRIFTWGDPDKAGRDFDESINVRNAQAVRLRDGDINETFLRGGADAIREAIARVVW